MIASLSNDELAEKLKKLSEKNFLVKKLISDCGWDFSKETIDNWPKASKPSLLKLLEVEEIQAYTYISIND